MGVGVGVGRHYVGENRKQQGYRRAAADTQDVRRLFLMAKTPILMNQRKKEEKNHKT